MSVSKLFVGYVMDRRANNPTTMSLQSLAASGMVSTRSAAVSTRPAGAAFTTTRPMAPQLSPPEVPQEGGSGDHLTTRRQQIADLISDAMLDLDMDGGW
eukprot:NODE_2320_length_438_cov_33.701799_g2239_i0.p1 GENE.NODE_2320_length_438_cov_33.701799_g2239_i0~~NODE_2320_length_438_cov_33.701799_g2239_i0.p1  ORF type:complete len:113 (+),score=42.76 NODE_2320_length_438_cov_33.701799_g2239_i0:44-340(+)